MLCCDYGLHCLSSVFLNYIGILPASSNAGFSTSALLIFETRWLSWGLMLPPDAKSWLIWKDSDAGRDWGQEEKGTTEDEMIGWNHWLNGHEFEQAPGIGDGQGVLQSMGSQRVGHDWVTELNWTELKWMQRSLVQDCMVNSPARIQIRFCCVSNQCTFLLISVTNEYLDVFSVLKLNL